MKVCLITPAPARSRKGNRVTALRWARILRELGHSVSIDQEYRRQRCDLLISLHARRTHASLARFRKQHPNRPLIVALTGTDLYGDIHTDPSAQQSLELASRLIVLQPMGVEALPTNLREKTRVIYQSARKPPGNFSPKKRVFEVCVLGHLRPVKDPFRAALAAKLLPPTSHVRVIQIGAALSDDMERQARAEEASNPRYRWLGELPRWKALRILARSRLLALTSKMEGGANVVSEALVCSVPIVSSRIAGSIGLLGEEYPGYFPVGDTQALAALLARAERDAAFYEALKDWCDGLQHLFEPASERKRWESLLEEFHDGGMALR
ncbi:MAG: selenoneine biosynthesis selenosugar synthase SenB [bacterium]|nr:selenoneine biosynthesis selenosugar synthase SenB [bacterium]